MTRVRLHRFGDAAGLQSPWCWSDHCGDLVEARLEKAKELGATA
ncbi:MAG: hypothetical protein ACLTNO_10515 [Blautia sp.]